MIRQKSLVQSIIEPRNLVELAVSVTVDFDLTYAALAVLAIRHYIPVISIDLGQATAMF